MSKLIAFVTYSKKPSIAEDDFSIITDLNELGIQVQSAAWDDPSVQWNNFDLVILRSSWNYHLHPDDFFEWLTTLEKNGIHVLNPISIVKWNMHKFYLRDLFQKGILMANTTWLNKRMPQSLSSLMSEMNTTRVVVKPCIAATAYQTFLVQKENALELDSHFRNLLKENDLIVQEFIPEVQTEGEWSILFFDKQFSHAVVKKPKADDFRVQNNFGGTSVLRQPSEMILEQAKRIIETIESPLLYARVDGVVSNGKFLLMELELIEPMLFLSYSEVGRKKFVNAIINSFG